MSLRTNLSSLTLKRLTLTNVTSRCLTSSRILMSPKRSSLHNVAFPQFLQWSLIRQSSSSSPFFQPSASFHLSSSKSSETRIDDSLNRLDLEIRKVGRIRRQEVDDIFSDIKEMKKATSSQSLMIIRCCGELIPEEPPNNRTLLVQQIWNTLESLKVPMDVSHYNALLRVYLENEYKFNPTEFLQDLTGKGIEPNRVTYQRLIARFCQDGDIDGASTILQHMKEKQMPINEYVFNSLILGHGQSNDMESAEGILTVMRQAGVEPNDDTYVTLLTCYAKQGDIANIHRIVKECEENEIFLIDKDFFAMIAALFENNHSGLVDEILPYLKKLSGFNQEATNTVFKLVNMGQEESAYKILKQMNPVLKNGIPSASGNFFLKHLVHLGRPSEMIIKYCRQLKSDGLNDYALIRACDFALISKNFDLAMDLIEGLHQDGFPIRQHYFWPIFASATSDKELYFGFKCMRDFGVAPSQETLREYIIPKALQNRKPGESLESTLQRLCSATGVSVATMASAALIHLLHNGEMSLAKHFVTSYRLPHGNLQLRRAIIEAYLRTGDASAFVHIVGSSSLDNNGDTDCDSSREYVGIMLMELIAAIRSPDKKASLIEPVLKELLATGLGLSNSGSELLQNSLGESLTAELANTIIQLTSPELVPRITLTQPDSNRRALSGGQMDEKTTEELEQMLAEAIRKNMPTKGIRKGLLYSYCRSRDVEKAVKLKDELSSEGFVFTPGLRAMMMDAYIYSGKLEEAKTEFNDLKNNLDFTMDDIKLLRYAQLLQSSGDIEGCIEVLKTTPRDESRHPQGAGQQATVWRLLNYVAESSQPEKVKEMFGILKERNLVPINNVTLGPLIKAEIQQDNLVGALEEFERCAQEYKATPWKQELFCRFIKLEDADKLQRVMDLSTNIHGEVNSMYDLVFAFIDCGKLRQAKKILETPGLRARNDKIEVFCQKYFQESRVEDLENLIQVTKDLQDVDRNAMYFYLLQTYCKLGDADKALSIWTNMQEENVQPSVELLIYLADFLRKSNRPIPFVVPDTSELPSDPTVPETKTEKVGLPRSIVEFRRCIEMNEIDRALQIQQRIVSDGSSLTLQDTSNLIEKLARAERLNEASRLTEQLLEAGSHPYPRVLRFLTARMGSAGDVNSLESLERKLSPKINGFIMMNSRLCHAYLNTNRGLQFFQNRIKKLVESQAESSSDSSSSDSSDDESDVGKVEGEEEEIGNIPVFGSTKLLVKNEQLVPEFEKLATIANAHHRKLLNNSLWGYFMIKKDFERARQLWNEKLKQEDRILFRQVLIEARSNNDADTALETVNQIFTSQTLPNNAKAMASAYAFDVLGSLGRIDEALSLLDKSLESVQLNDFPYGAILRLKEATEAANKTFKYGMPEQQSQNQQRRQRNGSFRPGDKE